MNRPPDISISRLAIYLRFLEGFVEEKCEYSTINSEELARSLDINPHQIRKDLSYFGKFGERGKGYRAEELRDKLRKILGLEKRWRLCLCGMGNLGSALFAYGGFRQLHLDIVAVFDNDPRKAGKSVRGVKIFAPDKINSVVRQMDINIAIVAVPPQSAQAITDKLTRAGVRAVLNFAPVKLNVPASVKLRNVDLSTQLISLTYFLSCVKTLDKNNIL